VLVRIWREEVGARFENLDKAEKEKEREREREREREMVVKEGLVETLRLRIEKVPLGRCYSRRVGSSKIWMFSPLTGIA
jgi:hypothetical protein